jgi:hypothetical protein
MRIVGIYFLLALFTIAPIVSNGIAHWVASACGCGLSEARVYPCIVHGVDVGEWLTYMLVSGWFAFLTLPIGLISMLVFTNNLLTRKKRGSA